MELNFIKEYRKHIGKDISEVRNNLVTIQEFIKMEGVKEEFLDRIVWLLQQKQVKQKLINIESRRDNDEYSFFNEMNLANNDTFTALIDEAELFLNQKLNKLDNSVHTQLKLQLNAIVELLFKEIVSKPYIVNPLFIFLIEAIYSITELGKHGTTRFQLLIDSGLYSDIYRRLLILQKKTNKIFLGEDSIQFSMFVINEWIKNLNLVNLDSKFPHFFAYTLSQTSSFNIHAFLNAQKSIYNGDFSQFLKLVLKKFKPIFNDITIEEVKSWVYENSTLSTESSNTGKYIFDGIIDGDLNKPEIDHFFEFLCKQTNHRNNKPFLILDDVIELKKIGLQYNMKNWKPQLTLNINKKEKYIIYSCFAHLWAYHTEANNTGRELYAYYLKTHFTNFNAEIGTIQSSLDKDMKGKIDFDIKNYLPKRLSDKLFKCYK